MSLVELLFKPHTSVHATPARAIIGIIGTICVVNALAGQAFATYAASSSFLIGGYGLTCLFFAGTGVVAPFALATISGIGILLASPSAWRVPVVIRVVR